MIDYGGDHFQPGTTWPDRGYAKRIFVGNTTGLRFTNDGQSYDQPVRTIFGTPGSRDGAIAKTHNADLGTQLFVRRGHAENISLASMGSDVSTRKRIHLVGEGDESERPTLTFTANAATWLLNTDSIIIENFNINLESAAGTGGVPLAVAAPITVSGNGCGFRKCKIRAGTDANNTVTVGITFTGNDCFLEDVFYYGALAAPATNHIVLTGTKRFRVRRLYIDAATTANAVGVIQSLTTANTMMDWDDFRIANSKAGSTAAVTGIAGDTGFVRNGHLHITANGTIATDQAGAWTTKGNVVFHDNVRVTDNVGEVGVSLLPVSA